MEETVRERKYSELHFDIEKENKCEYEYLNQTFHLII